MNYPSSMPFDMINIHDQSAYVEDTITPVDVDTIPSGPMAFIPFISPRGYGEDNKLMYLNSVSFAKFGTPNYKKYGLCHYDTEKYLLGTKKGTRRRIGLIAQDVQEALKEVYGTDNYADIVNDNFYDLVKKPDDVENQLTIAYQNIIPFLIGAIKELQTEIDQLKNK